MEADNSELSRVIDSLWERIDHVTQVANPVEREARVNQLVEELQVLAAQQPVADLYHALGYALYIHPRHSVSEFIQDRVEDALRRATAIDPTHARAWLYLGHNAYDRRSFASAYERFSKVPADALPPYLALKLEEMKVCCLIRLNGLPGALEALGRFVDRCELHPVQDVWPRELANVLAETRPTLSGEASASLIALARRLDRIGRFGDWFVEVVHSS